MNSQNKIKSSRLIVNYNGLKWLKMPSGYYFVMVKNFGGEKNLHRYVWVKNFGKIPQGFFVHHKDKNKDNNKIDNLELLSANEHAQKHSYRHDKKRYLKQIEHLNKIRPKKVYKWSQEPNPEKRAMHATAHKLGMSLAIPVERICKNCGTKFLAKPFGKHVFCSNKCKSAFRRKSKSDVVLRVCVICNKKFYINKFTVTTTCCRSHANVLRAKTIKEQKNGVG
ncbi:endonuclease HNH [Candidatus Termititenax aidoneus]|uniref:Endonuclease HNH n=1 Tax=Termititenax aidoneus TaxID=2218524 RepID=A0A388TB21_TERA1|nr:endonuclease HNH [Candidatus Termititenax aidoneus]